MEIKLTQNNNGQSFDIRQDDIITIALRENPTTGYRWTVDRLNEIAFILQSSDFLLPEDPKFGEGGTRIFVFRVKKVVNTHIQLKHWREWEGDSSIIDRFDVALMVEK